MESILFLYVEYLANFFTNFVIYIFLLNWYNVDFILDQLVLT
jgi:hypothetical protein